MGPRDILNKLKWHPDFDLDEAKITIVHRGAPRDRKIIDGSNVAGIGNGFMTVKTRQKEIKIPYHRILRIEITDEVLWRENR